MQMWNHTWLFDILKRMGHTFTRWSWHHRWAVLTGYWMHRCRIHLFCRHANDGMLISFYITSTAKNPWWNLRDGCRAEIRSNGCNSNVGEFTICWLNSGGDVIVDVGMLSGADEYSWWWCCCCCGNCSVRRKIIILIWFDSNACAFSARMTKMWNTWTPWLELMFPLYTWSIGSACWFTNVSCILCERERERGKSIKTLHNWKVLALNFTYISWAFSTLSGM